MPIYQQSTLMLMMILALFASSVHAEIGTASDNVESLFDSAQGIKLGGSILAVVAMIVGGVMVVFGYRLIRVTLFAIGFVAGGVGIAIIAERLFVDKSWVVMASWIAFAVGGIICGGIVTWLYPLSTFIAGVATGIMIAMILTNSVGYMIYPGHTQDVFIVACVIFGILFGGFAFKFGKPVLIVTTSLFGAGIVTWGVGYFAGDFPKAIDLEKYATEDLNGDLVYSIPSAWWAYLAGILVLFVFGMFIQFRKTARKVKHEKVKTQRHQVDPAPYVETQKSQRNERRDRPVMVAQPRQAPVRRDRHQSARNTPRPKTQRNVRQETQHNVRYQNVVVEVPHRQYLAQQSAGKPARQTPRQPEQQRESYSERESELYMFASSRDACRSCGNYVHAGRTCKPRQRDESAQYEH
ncbi:hypothetical protein BBJ28_00016275 [Nothophytophthora sp. Chile5]|nr:hypothetical protein BBJ28_00016275 [Nothophytophthora sp. Chile5]